MAKGKDISTSRYDEIDHIREDLADLKSNVVALSRSVKKDVKSEADRGIKTARNRSQKALKDIEGQVRENPGRSVALAFAGGLLASALLRGR